MTPGMGEEFVKLRDFAGYFLLSFFSAIDRSRTVILKKPQLVLVDAIQGGALLFTLVLAPLNKGVHCYSLPRLLVGQNIEFEHGF